MKIIARSKTTEVVTQIEFPVEEVVSITVKDSLGHDHTFYGKTHYIFITGAYDPPTTNQGGS